MQTKLMVLKYPKPSNNFMVFLNEPEITKIKLLVENNSTLQVIPLNNEDEFHLRLTVMDQRDVVFEYFVNIIKEIEYNIESSNSISKELKMEVLADTSDQSNDLADLMYFDNMVPVEITPQDVVTATGTVIVFHAKHKHLSDYTKLYITNAWKNTNATPKVPANPEKEIPIARRVTIKNESEPVYAYMEETMDNIQITLTKEVRLLTSETASKYLGYLNVDTAYTLGLQSAVIPDKIYESIKKLKEIKSSLGSLTILELANGFAKIEETLDSAISGLDTLFWEAFYHKANRKEN